MPTRAGNMSSSSFDGDYLSRYSRSKTVRNPRNLSRGLSDRKLLADIRSNEESLASWVWNFDGVETRLKSLISRGRYAEAKQYFDEINGTIDTNLDNLLGMTRAVGRGELGQELAARAERIVNGTFADDEVNFGGSTYSLGAILRDGGQLMVDAAREEFESLGLSGSAAEMMFNGSDQQRATLRALVNPLMTANSGNRAALPDARQRIDLIEEVTNRWDDLENTFGDGVPYLVSRLQAMHEGSGGAADTLRTLTKAASVMATDGVNGKELARRVIGSYGDLRNRIFAADTDPRSTSGHPSEQSGLSTAKTMSFDAALSAAVAACESRGVGVDMSSSVFSTALAEVMDAQAYASAQGIDLVSVGHGVGKSPSEAFGEYVADVVSGIPPKGANPINSLRSVRNMMDNLIIGGNDHQRQDYRATGNSSDYLKNLNKLNGGFSTSFGADGVAGGIKSYLLRHMAPGIMAGKDADTALRESMSGTAYSKTDFLVGLSEVIAGHMAGPGRNEAADLMSAKVMDSLLSGRKTSVEDIVFDLAFPENSTDDNLTAGQQTLRNWYAGNVESSTRMAPYITRLRAHYSHDEGLPEYYAAAELAKAAEESARMERMGRDPAAVYRNRLNVGTVYWPVTDPDGNPVTDPATGVPVIDRRIADRTQYGYNPDGDNTLFDAAMAKNREYYNYGKDYRVAAAKKSGANSVSEDI